ncbi:TPA: hypothetical protein N0F65_002692 [Lagenidium giganteum]|uniref:TLDc domain-containing protein n=1 Tax=Lagenidium giganteum TaxID=4803 RepID=A0AAV2Z503_9STRA|nr:TPA: hypothetical protein N0F65_002692 [Lagenidium giganteum]
MATAIKGLLQSIFDYTEQDSDNEDQDEGLSPSVARAASQRLALEAEALDGDGGDEETPYTAKQLDGEYSVWFTYKPLGIGLVPSTQLYGTWEVSSIAKPVARDGAASPTAPLPRHGPASTERSKIQRGDMIIAVNMSRKKAQLPRGEFSLLLQTTACPIIMTFRRPQVYGSLDSRSLSTAMFPTSIEYRDHGPDKKFNARASSEQWKRVLEHELARNARKAKTRKARQLASQLAQDLNLRSSTPTTPTNATKSNRSSKPTTPERSCSPVMCRRKSAELSPMGEFVYTFTEEPIHLTLAPSTRLYGSVEVYDPKVHAPELQVGDVIMSVNGDCSVARWTTDDLMDYLTQLHAPITVCFRRPAEYRKYLEVFFRSDKISSSRSLVTSMFPDSAEYKKSPPRARAAKRYQMQSPPPAPTVQGFSSPATANLTSPGGVMSPASPVAPAPLHSLSELKEFSFKINETDQFKLWRSGGKHGHTSRMLTEKHVRFLWKHLPVYLTCNDLELVYSTYTHGWNLLSFYSRLENRGPTVMVIRDEQDNIFGAFCSASWKQSTSVYGNGRSFVFSLRPRMRVYPWSGLNETFMFGRSDALFVGGGKKGTAVCIQLDEARGFSQPCDTFDSPRLSERENFTCSSIEVWCFSGLKI